MVNAGLIVKVNDAEAVPPRLSVTVAVIGNEPEELVLPPITPVEGVSVMPGGRLADGMDQV